MTRFLSVLCTASALTIAAASADAATMTVTNVVGQWYGVTGGQNVTTTAAGANPAELRWGEKKTWLNPNPAQSGYDFLGKAGGPYAAESPFDLGRFTHHNYAIPAGSSIDGAKLKVTYTVAVDGGVSKNYTSVFNFAHLETTNSNPCDKNGPGGKNTNNPCPDKVTATLNQGLSDAIETDEGKFYLTVAGFFYNNALLSSFWTQEGKSNHADLKASFTHEANLAPVPLPAAGLLLLGGLGALGAVSRRRKAA